MKRILIVLGSLDAGGAEARMLDVVKHLDKNDFQVDFLLMSLAENQFYEKEAIAAGAGIIKISPPSSKRLLKHYGELKSVMRAGNYDAVHANTSYHCGVVLMAAKSCKIKIRIAHARTTGILSGSLFATLFAKIGRRLVNRYVTDRIAISKESGTFLYGDRKDVTIIPNAFELDLYLSDVHEQTERLISEYSLSGNTVIGHVGRFDKPKNQMFLIKIFSEYLKSHEKSKLVLIGNGILFEDAGEYVKQLGIENNVIFLGHRKDVCLWMKIFDILVFPSIFEGLGNVAVEAQAAGTPCLCSDAVPHAVDMNLNITDFLSLEAPTDKWIKAIDALLAAEKPNVSEILKKFTERNYTIDSEINKLKQIYNRE